MAITERSEFKGREVIVLKWKEDDEYGFSFGISKARLILECIDAIEEFVEENTKKGRG